MTAELFKDLLCSVIEHTHTHTHTHTRARATVIAIHLIGMAVKWLVMHWQS